MSRILFAIISICFAIQALAEFDFSPDVQRTWDRERNKFRWSEHRSNYGGGSGCEVENKMLDSLQSDLLTKESARTAVRDMLGAKRNLREKAMLDYHQTIELIRFKQRQVRLIEIRNDRELTCYWRIHGTQDYTEAARKNLSLCKKNDKLKNILQWEISGGRHPYNGNETTIGLQKVVNETYEGLQTVEQQIKNFATRVRQLNIEIGVLQEQALVANVQVQVCETPRREQPRRRSCDELGWYLDYESGLRPWYDLRTYEVDDAEDVLWYDRAYLTEVTERLAQQTSIVGELEAEIAVYEKIKASLQGHWQYVEDRSVALGCPATGQGNEDVCSSDIRPFKTSVEKKIEEYDDLVKASQETFRRARQSFSYFPADKAEAELRVAESVAEVERHRVKEQLCQRFYSR